DAVRWVMGESSASRLRGDSMTDVIFNGSSARKPVGLASIELQFDNSDGKIGGQYAGFGEISVKRSVSRDGVSSYYLNGAKCRRKDITQIFLGTGLGPRSYSIIEQGMISRLIEAKPEDMRVFVEEAAGISKYKERRRETENRIRHTRENLERLTDLLEEVEKQLRRLDRQARTAERYKKLKSEERKTLAEVIALRLRDLDAEANNHGRVIAERENALQSAIANQRATESAIEEQREKHSEQTDSFNQIQGQFYKVGNEISRLEQSLEHNRELRERQQADLQQAKDGVEEIRALINKDQSVLEQLQLSLDALAPDLEQTRGREAASQASLQAAEQAMSDWQESWETFNARAGETQRSVQVEQTRIEQLQQRLVRLQERSARIQAEQSQLPIDELKAQLDSARTQAEQQNKLAEQAEAQLSTADETVARTRNEVDGANKQLDEHRSSLQEMRGRQASLQALQKAALGDEEAQLTQWLASQTLTDARRVAQQIRVDDGWERAVEIVLGGVLQGVCVDDLGGAARALESLQGGALTLVDKAQSGSNASAGRLLAKVHNAPAAALAALESVRCVDSVDEALRLREGLGDDESVVTPDGVWMGRHWLRVGQDETRAGVLQREEALRALKSDIAHHTQASNELDAQLVKLRSQLNAAEERRTELRQNAALANSQAANARTTSERAAVRLEETEQRFAQALIALEDTQRESDETQTTMRQSKQTLELSGDALASIDSDRERLEQQRGTLRQELERVRTQATEDRNAAQALALRFESGRSSRESAEQGLERMRAQMGQFEQRRDTLSAEITNAEAPIREMTGALEQHLEQRVAVEQQLGAARQRVENVEQQLREFEQQRHDHEATVNDAREALNTEKLRAQETTTRRESMAEQFAETGMALDAVNAELQDTATVEEWGGKLEALQKKIERLGPINLAAIDEQREQAERKQYLDSQLEDLTAALNTLENAIRKIDRETRNRFKETYDRVNAGFKRLFPQLFGGGQAYLELTGDDLLAAGVTVMARPPGKRNSTIHLLSGGEKALTAVALVFAIFELNPAPFCMLDEVDAPLDDANVGRFCNIVKQMSETVQFVFISHNKSTMEMAQQLMGVTMHEPGVSRLVAVDIDEAVRMAAV
ncbi:MAG: chromosome segregation protein SMC, partial [Pseudomonadota bacterium]